VSFGKNLEGSPTGFRADRSTEILLRLYEEEGTSIQTGSKDGTEDSGPSELSVKNTG
jgi:hypothetical protein